MHDVHPGSCNQADLRGGHQITGAPGATSRGHPVTLGHVASTARCTYELQWSRSRWPRLIGWWVAQLVMLTMFHDGVDTGYSGGKWLVWKVTPGGRTIVFRSNDRYAAETRLRALTSVEPRADLARAAARRFRVAQTPSRAGQGRRCYNATGSLEGVAVPCGATAPVIARLASGACCDRRPTVPGRVAGRL